MSLTSFNLEISNPDGWMALGKFVGHIKKASGAEGNIRSPQFKKVTHRVTVRAANGHRPRPRQRFRMGDVLLAIKAVIDRDGRGRSFVCLCEAL